MPIGKVLCLTAHLREQSTAKFPQVQAIVYILFLHHEGHEEHEEVRELDSSSNSILRILRALRGEIQQVRTRELSLLAPKAAPAPERSGLSLRVIP